ncbi:hypothetical protein FNF29_07357 [Cafeteria roenbergensis]|uniref:Lipocalin/cytosolic fatty-acid binding domain-containing protein n=1 Tax=Cafeteria roenbergensis TaxID=33653 RepID=A0A5A8C2V6_CAFRO|nr:hypothetical protein FNF29_07357 [Cafeteria roenbergensis]|eukprot:KAA0147412.1 hypothetical protein FNF29_07357 [Cafeteria roenbergensis]
MAATSSAAPPSRLNGKWKPNPAKSESIEPFLVEMGVSWLLRQAAKRQAPVMELTVTGTTFRQVMAGPMGKKTDNGGEFGTEIEWKTPMSTSMVTVTLTEDGDVLVSGASPNKRDPAGRMVARFSPQPDDTVAHTIEITRGDGSVLLIRRVLERVE